MKEFSQMITEKEVSAFIELTGDNNRIHWDKEYTKMFERPVAHGMLIASYISRMIGTMLPGEGTVWNTAEITWIKPVYIFDKIRVRAEILRERGGFAELQVDVFNQNDEQVIKCHCWVKK